MPIYQFRCSDCSLTDDRYLRFEDYDRPQACKCGGALQREICAPLMVKVSQNICYDSPITGKPITSMRERAEDLAKHNCRPYDPEMKTDYENRLKREDAALDKAVDTTVEREVALMPSRKRERLVNELSSGVTAEVIRRTA